MTQHSEISSSMIERDDDKIDLNSLINNAKHPVEIVAKWLQEANDLGLEKPEAMNLATVGIDGKPRNRMVLMRHITETQIYLQHCGGLKWSVKYELRVPLNRCAKMLLKPTLTVAQERVGSQPGLQNKVNHYRPWMLLTNGSVKPN